MGDDQRALSLTYSDGPDRIWQAHVTRMGHERNVLVLLELFAANSLHSKPKRPYHMICNRRRVILAVLPRN